MEEERYSVGDFCYIIDRDNKIKYCEVTKVYDESKEGRCYQVQDQVNFRYCAVLHENCADTKEQLKVRNKK